MAVPAVRDPNMGIINTQQGEETMTKKKKPSEILFALVDALIDVKEDAEIWNAEFQSALNIANRLSTEYAELEENGEITV